MKLINLTPHDITIVRPDRNILILASGSLARVSAKTETIGELDGIPVTETVFGEVEGLPAPKDGVAYIVSSLVAGRVPERSDVFIPNESIRDENGGIVGCKSLGRI